ncbi:MAG TPA: M20/M25/M40 family metallo-hydrolase [Ktedonobacteraceae bacterium]|nr:M20/M25/M40 family metallo-hydrolase [Ktedonobacteraceae bacterium]
MAQTSTGNLIDWQTAGDETIQHLRALLRLDTRNPPGNEMLTAAYLHDVLLQDGIDSVIIGPDEVRRTLVARLHGDGSAPPLLLMCHTDVVPVEPDKWTHDPFAADIADGFIYGRGALDMKHMVAMELMTMLLLKRANVPLKRDVIFLATADEETGGSQGVRWVAAHHPELVQAEYALNEGGGMQVEINGRRYYTIQAAEKGGAGTRLRARGRPGHASIPHDDNAIYKLAAALLKLRERKPPVHLTATFRAFIEGIAQTQPPAVAQTLHSLLADEATADAALHNLPFDESIKQQFSAMMRNTATPTILSAGNNNGVNVIPSEAEIVLDARILPGQTPDTFWQELRQIVGEDVDIEPLYGPDTPLAIAAPLEVDFSSPLVDTITSVLKDHDPQATVIPWILTGGTDAKALAPLGVKAYGFTPVLFDGVDEVKGIHGHDERISLRSMHWGIRILYEVVERFAAT